MLHNAKFIGMAIARCRLEEEVAGLRARCKGVEEGRKRAAGELQALRDTRGVGAVIAALPPLPKGAGPAVSASVLSPKQSASPAEGAVALLRKLRQTPLPAVAQKLVDKLDAVTQVRPAALGRRGSLVLHHGPNMGAGSMDAC